MFFRYKNTPDNIGVGVENIALSRPHGPVMGGTYGPAYNVRKSVDILSKGFVQLAQDLPTVDLRANGVYLSGEMALQALSDFENQEG